MSDFYFATRWFLKHRAFTALAVLTLALGIGVNTAIFSVFKAVLLNPLPFHQPERLVTLALIAPTMPYNTTVDAETVMDWRTRVNSFENVTLYADVSTVLVENGQGEIVRGLRVNSNFFDTLGVKMHLGRAFLPDEDRPDRKFAVVILSYGFWMRRFGGDRHIVGRVLNMGGSHYTVVGVLSAKYTPLLHGTTELLPEIYMPLGIDYRSPCRTCLGPRAIARLRPGVTAEAARAELNTAMRSIVREHPAAYHREAGVSVTPIKAFLLGRVSAAIWTVLGAAGFVLLIACANVASLLLARGAARTKEMALRVALGAGRWELVRLTMAESLVLGIAGGGTGFLITLSCTRVLIWFLPAKIPRTGDIRIDAGVLAFVAATSLVTAALCGIVPALQIAHADLIEALKSSGGSANLERQRMKSIVLIGELALAFVLTLGALLMAKSFLRLMHVDPGYDARNVLTLSSNVWGSWSQNESRMLSYYQQALEKLKAVSGIEDAAWTSALPLDWADAQRLYIEERPAARESEAPLVDVYSVSTDYFHVMKIPLKHGRVFTERDTDSTPRVALISESCARAQFREDNPIGKHIHIGGLDEKPGWATVVGVVGDIHQDGLDKAPIGEAYVAQSQEVIIGYYRLVARTTLPPMSLDRAVRAAFASVDSAVPVYHIKALDEYLAGTLAARTLTFTLLGHFAALALILAAVGVFGVIAYNVTRRTREIGIRLALGAERRTVLSMVLRESAVVVGTGVVVGFAAFLPLSRMIESFLFGVHTEDAAMFCASVVILVATGLLASYIPARRACRIDPADVLRCE